MCTTINKAGGGIVSFGYCGRVMIDQCEGVFVFFQPFFPFFKRPFCSIFFPPRSGTVEARRVESRSVEARRVESRRVEACRVGAEGWRPESGGPKGGGPKGGGPNGESGPGGGKHFALFFFLSRPSFCFFSPTSKVFRGIAVVSGRFHH